jgi:hypothetical protein
VQSTAISVPLRKWKSGWVHCPLSRSLGQDTRWTWSLVLLPPVREQLLPSVTILPGHTASPNDAPQEPDPI